MKGKGRVRNQKNKEALQTACLAFTDTFKNIVLLVVCAAVISSPLHLPHIKAYFTDEISYSDSRAPYGGSRAGIMALNSSNFGAVELSFDIHRFNFNGEFKLDLDRGILVVTISFPEYAGFKAADVMESSLQLICDAGGGSMPPNHIETADCELFMTFAWPGIENIIGEDGNPGFTVSGKGAGKGVSGLGEKFTFSVYGAVAVPVPEEPELEDPEGIIIEDSSPGAGGGSPEGNGDGGNEGSVTTFMPFAVDNGAYGDSLYNWNWDESDG